MIEPRTRDAYKRNRAFTSAAERFTGPCEASLREPEKDNPGPGKIMNLLTKIYYISTCDFVVEIFFTKVTFQNVLLI